MLWLGPNAILFGFGLTVVFIPANRANLFSIIIPHQIVRSGHTFNIYSFFFRHRLFNPEPADYILINMVATGK